jgi:hypothetical protein
MARTYDVTKALRIAVFATALALVLIPPILKG